MARVVFITIGLLMLTRGFLYNIDSPLGGYYSTLARADALLMGCGFALIPDSVQAEFWQGRKGRLVAWSCGVTLLGLFAGVDGIADFLPLGGFTAVAAYAAAVILYAVYVPNGFMGRALSSNWLVEIGKRSYGIYLYHNPIFVTFDHLIEKGMNSDLADFLKLVLTAIISYLSYKYIETPFLKKMQMPRGQPTETSAPLPHSPPCRV